MSVQRKRLSKEARREQIVDEACRLFAVKGFESTTTKDIAAAVGVGESLIFHYFPSKEDIFQAILNRWIDRGLRLRPLKIIDGSAISTLRAYVENSWKYYIFSITGDESMDVLVHMAVVNRQNYDTQRTEAALKVPDMVTTVILPIIVYGQEKGEIRDGDPLELASLFHASVVGVSYLRRDYQNVYSMPSVDLLLDIFRKQTGGI